MIRKIEIFKPGSYSTANGEQFSFGIDEINQIVSSYDPSQFEAPCVLGHPEDNSVPAYGWVKGLSVNESGILEADCELSDWLEFMIQDKLYRYRSIALDNDNNLVHIGFLGGAAPAVKGLKDIEFSFSDYREFMAEENADYNVPVDPDVSDPVSPAVVDDKPEGNNTNFSSSDPVVPEYVSNILSFQQDLISQISKLQNQVSSLSSDIKKSEFTSFLDDKVISGNITPAMNHILSELAGLASDDKKELAESKIREFCSLIPKIIESEDILIPNKESSGFSVDPEFLKGHVFDQKQMNVHNKILELSRQDNIPYAKAFLKYFQIKKDDIK